MTLTTGRGTVSRGVTVPTVLQMEAAECGAACLTMVLRHHGVDIELEEVRETCAVSRDGIDALRIVTAARSYGLDSKGYQLPAGTSWPASRCRSSCSGSRTTSSSSRRSAGARCGSTTRPVAGGT